MQKSTSLKHEPSSEPLTLNGVRQTASIYSEVLENACAWNPVAQTCMLWVVRVRGDEGELRPWHYIYVYSIETLNAVWCVCVCVCVCITPKRCMADGVDILRSAGERVRLEPRGADVHVPLQPPLPLPPDKSHHQVCVCVCVRVYVCVRERVCV